MFTQSGMNLIINATSPHLLVMYATFFLLMIALAISFAAFSAEQTQNAFPSDIKPNISVST